MHRRILALSIAACCLVAVLTCGAGTIAIRQGLVQPPMFSARIGSLQIAAYTERVVSNIHPPHAYLTLWVFTYPERRPGRLTTRTPLWGRRLLQFEIADLPIPRR